MQVNIIQFLIYYKQYDKKKGKAVNKVALVDAGHIVEAKEAFNRHIYPASISTIRWKQDVKKEYDYNVVISYNGTGTEQVDIKDGSKYN